MKNRKIFIFIVSISILFIFEQIAYCLPDASTLRVPIYHGSKRQNNRILNVTRRLAIASLPVGAAFYLLRSAKPPTITPGQIYRQSRTYTGKGYEENIYETSADNLGRIYHENLLAKSRSYMERIKVLEEILSRCPETDFKRLETDLRRKVLEDLCLLWFNVNPRKALEHYLAYCQLLNNGKYDGYNIRTIARLYVLSGEPEKAEEFCRRHLLESGLSNLDKKEINRSLIKIYQATGQYDKILALQKPPLIAEVKRLLDLQHRPYVPLVGWTGDMASFSQTSNIPLHIFIGNNRSHLMHRDEAVEADAVRFFTDVSRDISYAFSYLSGGKFSLELKTISFDEIRPLVPAVFERDRQISLLTSPDVMPYSHKGFILLFNYPVPFFMRAIYNGNGFIFMKDSFSEDSDKDKMRKTVSLNLMHELLHGLGMHHPFDPVREIYFKNIGYEVYDARWRWTYRYVIPETGLECPDVGCSTLLALSEPLRVRLRWPNVKPIPLSPSRSLRDDIESVTKTRRSAILFFLPRQPIGSL